MTTITKLAGDDRTVLTLVTLDDGTEAWATPVREAGVGFVGWRIDGETAIVRAFAVER